MPLPDQTPKLPKIPFLVGDAALLAAAWFIGDGASRPWQPEAMFAVAGCVLCGGLLGAIPFLTDYARRQDEALDDRQRGLEALARTVAASAEQISIAAQGLNEIADLAQRNLRQAEQLPHKLQEKMAEFRGRAAGNRDEEIEELEKELAALRASETDRIESAVDKLSKAAALLLKAEDAVALRAAAPPAQVRADAPEAAPVRPDAAVGPEIPPPDTGTAASPAPVPRAPRKPRGPRKPKVEDAAPVPTEASELQPELPVAAAADSPSEFSQIAPDEEAPVPAVSSDGATRLLVTAYIGIGNRIFIRGDGPGLSWEKGVPLQFVSIGKWRWEAPDATAPVRFKLYKNDEVECAALGERSVEAGSQQELSASF